MEFVNSSIFFYISEGSRVKTWINNVIPQKIINVINYPAML